MDMFTNHPAMPYLFPHGKARNRMRKTPVDCEGTGVDRQQSEDFDDDDDDGEQRRMLHLGNLWFLRKSHFHAFDASAFLVIMMFMSFFKESFGNRNHAGCCSEL